MSIVEIRNPRGPRFRALLAAIERVERLGALRSLLFHALAVIGVVLWISVVLPTFPALLRRYALAAFATLSAVAVVAVALEWHWHRVQRRCMQETDATVLDGDDPGRSG